LPTLFLSVLGEELAETSLFYTTSYNASAVVIEHTNQESDGRNSGNYLPIAEPEQHLAVKWSR
jgi:hypothetical protein